MQFQLVVLLLSWLWIEGLLAANFAAFNHLQFRREQERRNKNQPLHSLKPRSIGGKQKPDDETISTGISKIAYYGPIVESDNFERYLKNAIGATTFRKVHNLQIPLSTILI